MVPLLTSFFFLQSLHTFPFYLPNDYNFREFGLSKTTTPAVLYKNYLYSFSIQTLVFQCINQILK